MASLSPQDYHVLAVQYLNQARLEYHEAMGESEELDGVYQVIDELYFLVEELDHPTKETILGHAVQFIQQYRSLINPAYQYHLDYHLSALRYTLASGDYVVELVGRLDWLEYKLDESDFLKVFEIILHRMQPRDVWLPLYEISETQPVSITVSKALLSKAMTWFLERELRTPLHVLRFSDELQQQLIQAHGDDMQALLYSYSHFKGFLQALIYVIARLGEESYHSILVEKGEEVNLLD